MLLLAVDTSAAISAAVCDGQRVLAQWSAYDPRRHAELLVPAVDEVLRAAGVGRGDLTDIAVGVGPGPFTGLRVGLVTARTLGLVLGVPVHGVCSLDALALSASRVLEPIGDLVVATDARRKEVYWARYRAGLADGDVVRLTGPDVAHAVDVQVDGATCVGRGAVLFADALPGPGEAAPLDPQAGALAELAAVRLGRGDELLPPEPLYLRRPDAVPTAARKRVLR